jgi:hypothetical protein
VRHRASHMSPSPLVGEGARRAGEGVARTPHS